MLQGATKSMPARSSVSSVCPSVRHVRISYADGWRYRQTFFSTR